MTTLRIERSVPRFAAARLASSLGSGRGAALGPLRLTDDEPPVLPGADWARVDPLLSGICGSDLATVDGRSSRTFEDVVSFPFVPGHEVVGTLAAAGRSANGSELAAGTRVVIEPVLGCVARGIVPPCAPCAAGSTGRCEHTALGHLLPGLQTGYCADTGGGWSTAGLVAHASQIHAVPESLDDRDAVTVEPAACALHAACAAQLTGGEQVAVIGAGTVGLLVVAALRHLQNAGQPAPGTLLVGARYPHQRAWARELGADAAVPADHLGRSVRRTTRSLALGDGTRGAMRLTGGADTVVDCVGSAGSVATALDLVRPGGRVVLTGMPGRMSVDLAPLWRREVQLVGAYAYGTELVGDRPRPVRTFELALQMVEAARTGRLVSAVYPLERFEEALAHAGSAGRRNAVKVAFDVAAGARARAERRGSRSGEGSTQR